MSILDPAAATPAPRVLPRALRPHKELLIARTMLLLDAEPLHGYRLHQALRNHGLDLVATSLYRRLHRFERDGWVTSDWAASVDGPGRRVYRLTPQGRVTLHEMSAMIAGIRDTYSAFLLDHGRALARRGDGGDGDAAAPVPRDPLAPATAAKAVAPAPGPRPHRELLAGRLLLHLDAGATYGYDLRRDFDAHGLHAEPSAMYRMLRRLEADKWVQSRWMSPAAGPPRRFYRLTTRGRRNLDEIAVLIAAIRDTHDTYLREYEQAYGLPDA